MSESFMCSYEHILENNASDSPSELMFLASYSLLLVTKGREAIRRILYLLLHKSQSAQLMASKML